MLYVSFKILEVQDAVKMSQLLLNETQEYTKYFHPFDFDISTIKLVLQNAVEDRFFGVEIRSDLSEGIELIGFYMLRGFDEGYTDPMYGVFISSQYTSKGIGRLTISHAECFCRFQGCKNILLKVFPHNLKAKRLYDYLGFKFLRKDELSNQLILYKSIN
jgi:RimJ/RimL family protein N-acetyltransferase